MNVQSHPQLFVCIYVKTQSEPLDAREQNRRQLFQAPNETFPNTVWETHGLLTSREILDKLFHWNCEWLTRPNYAISELADTLYANLATLADYKDKVFTKHAVDPLLNKA